MRLLDFSNHEKGAPRSKPPVPLSSWSLRQAVCSTFSGSGWSVVRSESLSKGEVLRKRDRHRTFTKFQLGVIRWVHELFKMPSYGARAMTTGSLKTFYFFGLCDPWSATQYYAGYIYIWQIPQSRAILDNVTQLLNEFPAFYGTRRFFTVTTRARQWIRGCIQKFQDWVDNEINAYNNKHSLRSNTKGYGDKTH
jgi:hypothetical protein